MSGAASGSMPPKAGERQQAYKLSDFDVVSSLGKGSFGVVSKVVHRHSGQAFAMKVLDKRKVIERGLQEQLKREVVTQLKAKHRNVVRMLYYFEDKGEVSCLLEYADRGQLFAYLRRRQGGIPEVRAAAFFADTAHGLEYLHGMDVVHRDIKPENILLFGEALACKIGDLGWCVELTPHRPERKTFCGTMDYIAPEMLLDEPHDTSVDLWALGVLLFEMLIGGPPFVGSSPKEVGDRICSGQLEIPAGSMTSGPMEIIQGLLVQKKALRWSIEKVLRHPWTLGTDKAGGHPRLGKVEAIPETFEAARIEDSVDSVAIEITRNVERRPAHESPQTPAQQQQAEDAADRVAIEETCAVGRSPEAVGDASASSQQPARGPSPRREPLQVDEVDQTRPVGRDIGTTGDALARIQRQMDAMNRSMRAKVAAQEERSCQDVDSKLDLSPSLAQRPRAATPTRLRSVSPISGKAPNPNALRTAVPLLEVSLKATRQGFVWEHVGPEETQDAGANTSSASKAWLPEAADLEYLSVVDDNTIALQDMDDDLSMSSFYDSARIIHPTGGLRWEARNRGVPASSSSASAGASLASEAGRSREHQDTHASEKSQVACPPADHAFKGHGQSEPGRAEQAPTFARPHGSAFPALLQGARHRVDDESEHNSKPSRHQGGSDGEAYRSHCRDTVGAEPRVQQPPAADDHGFFTGSGMAILDAGASVWGSLFGGIAALSGSGSAPQEERGRPLRGVQPLAAKPKRLSRR